MIYLDYRKRKKAGLIKIKAEGEKGERIILHSKRFNPTTGEEEESLRDRIHEDQLLEHRAEHQARIEDIDELLKDIDKIIKKG
jgi:hypothetical protein